MTDNRHVDVDPITRHIETLRLILRPWTLDDANAARQIYAAPEVARWLSPAMPAVDSSVQMRDTLSRWISETDAAGLPLGRWAVVEKSTGLVVGGVALLPLPPGCTDLEIGWQVGPAVWGRGYGAEAGHAVAHQAFDHGRVSELFAVVRPGNHRGIATARRVGMEWVGESDKYYGLFLQIYRLARADLDLPEPGEAPGRPG